jgi:hypothetical protein
MKQTRNDTYQSGLAAEYLITSCVIRLGLEAYITTGNRKRTDIRVINTTNNKACSIDVKAVRGYSSIVINNVETYPGHFLVLVIFNKKLEKPEYSPDIYIVPSEDIEKIVSYFNKEKRVMKKSIVDYKSKWNYIQDYVK